MLQGHSGRQAMRELAERRWDAVIVGAGHNGLACAAYLAREGLDVLVVEARDRLGGACTLEEIWPGFTVSPCAYLLGLLHPLVIDELDLIRRGLSWTLADAGMFVPFEDGSSVQLWDQEAKCEDEIRRLAPRDLPGFRAMSDLKARVRDALRPSGDGDLWVGPAPDRTQIEKRLGGDPDAIGLVFEWSMTELLDRYLTDDRLKQAYLGQGVIGTNAAPQDPGTASIHFHHQSGRLGGVPGAWGYVRGGMGRISGYLADAAIEHGAVIARGLPVAAIEPGRGVVLAGGDRIEARCVVSNADPLTTLDLLGDQADDEWASQVRSIPMVGCTAKLNVALRDLPDFAARPGLLHDHHHGQVNIPLSADAFLKAHRSARAGELPKRLWAELYFQTVHDPSVAPEGLHTMSVFAQYVPHTFAQGTWETRRDEVERVILDSIKRFCPSLDQSIIAVQTLGPPDIEERVGLRGGHIFQGECLPPFMWDKRLKPNTPMDGVYLCGACTHPGGSVIGINGRNAAMKLLEDRQARPTSRADR